MADTETGGAAADTSAQAPTVATVSPAQSVPAKVEMTSDALKARLEEERGKARAALLKDFGFDKPGDLKAVLDAAKAKADAELSETQRLTKALEESKPHAARADKLEKQLAALVDAQFNALPEAVRTSIDEVAAGNAEERLRMIGVFQKSGLLKAPATAAPGPATTTPGPAPKPTNAQSPWDKFQALEKSNPLLASAFYQTNRAAIDESRPAQ